LVGGSLVVGALLASALDLPARASAAITAFGGGILLAAVALELVPEADERAGLWRTAFGLLAGAFVYVCADRLLAEDSASDAMRRSGHAAAAGREVRMTAADAQGARGESLAAGLFVDGVPESIALGLTIAEGEVGLALLAGIVVGNITEAYGAAQPLTHKRSRAFAVGLLGAIGLTLAAATVLGAVVEWGSTPVGVAESVAAGAVLAVVSVSIIPYAFGEVSRWVALAATLGFVAGYLLS
jgi:ZIP family zinc transporter